MIYEQSTISGKWAKAAELGNVKRAKIVSEASPQPSQFKDEKTGAIKTQDVARVQFEGLSEPLNVNLNRATVGGLIRAFGKDSKDWMGHYLTVQTEKGKVSGRNVPYLFLIPEGFKKVEDSAGYDVIVPEDEGGDVSTVSLDEDEEPSAAVPF